MRTDTRGPAIALIAAALFGLSTPAKLVLGETSPWLLAALLYLGRHVARSVLDPAATPGYFTERGVGQRA